MNLLEKQQKIIKTGFELFSIKKQYSQKTVVDKIKFLGHKTATATLSKILNNKIKGSEALKNTSRGMRDLIEAELCLKFDNTKEEWIAIPNCISVEVEELTEKSQYNTPGFKFHSTGRLKIEEQVNFYSTAQKEIIEFGAILNSFTSHFFSRNENEFKVPIHRLLKKGVNLKCYLMNPDSSQAMMYFNDRKQYIPEETNGIKRIKKSLDRFKDISYEIQENHFSGRFEVFTYRHIPSEYFLVVDGDTPNGKMIISHYLYGELRANCPIIECTKKDNPSLFKKYWSSLQKLTKYSSRADFQK